MALSGIDHALVFSGTDLNIGRLDSGQKKTRASACSADSNVCNFSLVTPLLAENTTVGIQAPFTVPSGSGFI